MHVAEPEHAAIPNSLPESLKRLQHVKHLFFIQRVQPWACLRADPRDRFSIRNEKGQDLFFVRQDNNCARRCWAIPSTLYFEVVDMAGNDMIHMVLPWSCGGKSLEVSTPPNVTLGVIKKLWSLRRRQFRVVDGMGTTLVRIKGPGSCTLFTDVTYEVLSADGTMSIGSITKMTLGFPGSLFKGADRERYEVIFSSSLDIRIKALIIAACLQIDLLDER